jgi:hypothetical protein
MIRTEYSSSLSSRPYVCFFIFSHSTFDPPEADKCSFFQSLLGKNNLALMNPLPEGRGQDEGLDWAYLSRI